MGAVPKRRISKARRNKRRTHDVLKPYHLVACPECGHMRRAHHVCLNCGTYKGIQVLPDKRE